MVLNVNTTVGIFLGNVLEEIYYAVIFSEWFILFYNSIIGRFYDKHCNY